MEQSAASGLEVQPHFRAGGLGGRSIAVLAAAVALLAYLASLLYAGEGGYSDGPTPAIPYTMLCLVVAGLAVAAAVMPGRYRRLRLAALAISLGLTGAAVGLFFAVDPFMPLGFAGLAVLTALPLICAAVLVWRGEAEADRRRAPRLAVALVTAAGLLAFPASALVGYGISSSVLVLVSVVALCSAGIMRSRYRVGAVGALLCTLPLARGAFAELGQPWSAPPAVAVTCVPVAALLIAGAVLAWRASGRHNG